MSNTAAKHIVIVSRLKSASKIKQTISKQIVNVETSKRVFYIVENKIKNVTLNI
jgi:hypothetical protein